MVDSTDFLEWIDYAEEDWNSAHVLLITSIRNATWLFQQSVEKYLKAILLKNDQKPPRTHDIQQFLELNDPTLDFDSDEAQTVRLIDFIAPKIRYPDGFN